MARVERLGKYELLRHLASGGMARVYLARVEGVGGFTRHLVLKTMRPERTEDTSYVSMFLDEARLVATLHHQHIAQVYDIGVAEDGTYFLAMEYLHGETMRHVLERARDLRQRLPLDFSLTVVAAAAAGLHHAHERRGPDGRPLGIVHRDVTPSNVIAGYDGSVKLIDFGIAKAAERSTQTKTGFIKGKAGYMAPEQALGHPVDRRADVFSLGVMLYELTTQTRAFPAASELEVAHRIVRGEVTPPSVAVAGYPSELEDVVMSALARDPDERFGDADALGHAVNYAASHLGVALGPAAVSRVLEQLFGLRPEPWLAPEVVEEDVDASRTGDTASLLDSRPLLATSATPGVSSASASASAAVGFARGTGAVDAAARAATERSGPVPVAPPEPALAFDDDDDDGDEMPTVKFVALDEAEIIIEHGTSRSTVQPPPGQPPSQPGARVLKPLPGLTDPPPPARVITAASASGPASVTPTPTPRPPLDSALPAIIHAPIPRPPPSKLTPPPRPPVGSQPPPFEPAAPAVAAKGTSSAPHAVPPAVPPARSAPVAAIPPSATPIAVPPSPPPAPPPSASPVPRAASPLAPSLEPASGPLPAPPPVTPMASPMPGTPLPRAVTARPVTARPVTAPSPIGMRTEEVMAFSTYERRARRIRVFLPLLAGAALAILVILVGASLLGGDDAAVTRAQPIAADPPPPVVTPPPVDAPPPPRPVETTTIKVHVTSTPDDATVVLDGERLGRTPLTVERPRKPGTASLKVRKRGYKTRIHEVDLGADVVWDITLPKSR